MKLKGELADPHRFLKLPIFDGKSLNHYLLVELGVY